MRPSVQHVLRCVLCWQVRKAPQRRAKQAVAELIRPDEVANIQENDKQVRAFRLAYDKRALGFSSVAANASSQRRCIALVRALGCALRRSTCTGMSVEWASSAQDGMRSRKYGGGGTC